VTLRLVREPSADGATFGVLFVDGRFECFTIEDQVRSGPKVPGKTAIPAGRYQVVVTPSARFQRRLPLLVDVPGFSGIRIHPGNTINDTDGCLLPGTRIERTALAVRESRVAFQRLFAKLEAADGDQVWITIENAA
jgi:hypothetical protein